MDDFFDFDRAAGGDVPYPAHRSLDSTQGHGGPRTRNSRGPDLYRFTNPAAPRLVEQSSCDTASVEPCSMEKGGHSKPAYDRARMAGSRFSMEVVKILRCWFSAHDHYPYPSDRQTKALEAQTGLTKGQITTWLANARRKKKCKTPRVHNAINLPDTPRPPTPLPRSMNPLERWQHSPPDDEPAAASAIFDAINRSAPSSECGEGSNNLRPRSSSGSRCHAPSTSATETSVQSSESCSSVCSSASGESSGSFSSLKINKYRRRSRRPQRQSSASLNASTRPRTFQCTFCTDSFKTKYDWQRHEKSLHLSLEMWTCAAGGPTALSPDINLPLCVYCGAPEPDPPHLEAHNHSSCAAHSVESRTFYRKDHFRQHLKLVHCARFQSWSMSVWKTEMLSVRARCGFCGLWVDTWTARAAHLADHFKNGKTMADWKGDWGFEPEILALLENEMPPYLIHKERMSLLPYIATRGCPQARRTLYDLVKMGLVDFINDLAASGKVPTDEDLLRQSRQICYAIDNATDDNRYRGATWFRDLLFHEVKDHKFRDVGSSSLETMNSPGKQHPEERKLKDFVNSCKQLGIVPTESQLQMNALRILADLECTSSFRCNAALSWFKFLITSSNKWLRDFRLRTQLLYCPDMPEDVQGRGSDFPAAIDRIQRSSLLSLVDYAVQQDSNYHITEPVQWSTSTENTSDTLHWDIGSFTSAPKQLMGGNLSLQRSPAAFDCQALPLYPKAAQNMQNTGYSSSKSANFQTYSFSDANCYRRLTHELGRFVSSCISDSNPARHWPSDEEIQRQARWIIFDDDDPWNQTAADHPEWLASFKRDVGLT